VKEKVSDDGRKEDEGSFGKGEDESGD